MSTFHGLYSSYRSYRDSWRVQNLFEQKPFDELIELAGVECESAEDLLGWSDAQNARLRRLEKHLKLKRINEEDFNWWQVALFAITVTLLFRSLSKSSSIPADRRILGYGLSISSIPTAATGSVNFREHACYLLGRIVLLALHIANEQVSLQVVVIWQAKISRHAGCFEAVSEGLLVSAKMGTGLSKSQLRFLVRLISKGHQS